MNCSGLCSCPTVSDDFLGCEELPIHQMHVHGWLGYGVRHCYSVVCGSVKVCYVPLYFWSWKGVQRYAVLQLAVT